MFTFLFFATGNPRGCRLLAFASRHASQPICSGRQRQVDSGHDRVSNAHFGPTITMGFRFSVQFAIVRHQLRSWSLCGVSGACRWEGTHALQFASSSVCPCDASCMNFARWRLYKTIPGELFDQRNRETCYWSFV